MPWVLGKVPGAVWILLDWGEQPAAGPCGAETPSLAGFGSEAAAARGMLASAALEWMLLAKGGLNAGVAGVAALRGGSGTTPLYPERGRGADTPTLPGRRTGSRRLPGAGASPRQW